MASIYDLEPEKLFTVPHDDEVTVCKLCYEIAKPKDGIDLGPLYQYGKIVSDKLNQSHSAGEDRPEMEIYCAHYFCLLFCSALSQRGEDDSIGMKGFLTEDILKEWRRASRLKCFRCNKKYATVGCAAKKCRKSFHLSCALRDKALPQFCSEFRLYCGDHRLKQAIYCGKESQIVGERECGICSEQLSKFPEDTIEEEVKNIWSPCCNKWFHKYCIQKFAATAGYFFKCPLCNNKEIFETEMQSFGVYVPEQDAEWETQDNGTLYDDLLERHNRCDADECVCPEGRETDEDYTIWEIILCWCCGAQGIHVKCGDLPLSKDMVKWKCKECLETIKKMPKRTIHKFRRIQNRRSRKSVYMHSRQTLEDILDTTTIKLEHSNMETSGENISKIECILNDEGISARIDACPKYDIPLPVKISNVPWVDKDPGLEKLKELARKSYPTVQLKKMELNNQRYSVYTLWKPVRRLPAKQLNEKIEIESMTTDNNDYQCTPLKKISDSHIIAKPRSPSLPKFHPRKPVVSPRSQSLPPKFNSNLHCSSYSSILDKSDTELQSLVSDKLTYTPKKVKFSGILKRKECLTTLKPMEHKLNSLSESQKEILELPSLVYGKLKNKTENHVRNTCIGHINEVVTSTVSPSKVLCEKRKNILDSPHKAKKKLKHESHSNIICQSKRNIGCNEGNNGLMSNERFIPNCSGKDTKYLNESKKENTNWKKSDPRLIKGRSNLIDKPKSQKSILQYFSTE